MVVIYCYDLIIIPIAGKQCKRAIVELEETFLNSYTNICPKLIL
jgi:hypothetical protein